MSKTYDEWVREVRAAYPRCEVLYAPDVDGLMDAYVGDEHVGFYNRNPQYVNVSYITKKTTEVLDFDSWRAKVRAEFPTAKFKTIGQYTFAILPENERVELISARFGQGQWVVLASSGGHEVLTLGPTKK